MPKDDGVHNYHFGQMPEMPWKREENKMKIIPLYRVKETSSNVITVQRTIITGLRINIRFIHTYPTRKPHRKDIKYGTVCIIYPEINLNTNVDSTFVVRAGKTYLHPNDDFDFRTGEKIALERALSKYPFKTVRKMFWDVWLEHYPPKDNEFPEEAFT